MVETVGAILCLDEIAQVYMQGAQHAVGRVHRQPALAFQHMVNVGLGDAGQASDPALRDFAGADPLANVRDEPLLQLLKAQHGNPALFLFEIEEYKKLLIPEEERPSIQSDPLLPISTNWF
jgi:hypothetical protein